METLCPKCQKRYVVSDSLVGKQARCKNQSCGEAFTIAPNAAGKPMPVQPVPMAIRITPPAAVNEQPFPNLPDLSSLPMDDFGQAGLPAAAPANFTAPRPKKNKFNPAKLKLVGGLAAVLIVATLLVLLIVNLVGGSGSGVPNWATYFIPEDAQMIAYVNVDKIRGSDLFADVRDAMNKQVSQMGANFTPDDVSELVIVGQSVGWGQKPLTISRWKKDYALRDVLPKDGLDQSIQTYKGIEYVSLKKSPFESGGLIAKTGDRTFCIAPNEDSLKKTIERLDRKQEAKLDKNLQSALDSVGGCHAYVVGLKTQSAAAPVPFEVFYARAWLTSSLQVELTAVCTDAAIAKKGKAEIDQGLSRGIELFGKTNKDLASLLSAISVRQNGKKLCVEAKWQNKDLMALKNSGMPFPGPGG
jgi:hypothetical protein